MLPRGAEKRLWQSKYGSYLTIVRENTLAKKKQKEKKCSEKKKTYLECDEKVLLKR